MAGGQDSLHGETAARRQAITELLFFSSVGDLYRCRKIIQAWGLKLKEECCDYDKRTPLHLAAAEGCFSVVAWLLDQGVEVNPIDRFMRTPLEDAVRGDHGAIATLLIEKGAKVLSKDKELVDLADSPLSGNVRIFTDYDPEWEIDPSSLLMLEKVGEGEFGVVHKASWNGTIVAVKILKEANAVAIGDFRTELNVLQKVHHPYTVQFLGAVTKQVPFMIVTEYMTGGSLADIFRKGGFPSMWRAVQLALDCAKGLAYMHNRKPHAVIHRDLKPANLMLGGTKIYTSYHRKLCVQEVGTLKIADFGLSKSLKLSKPKRHALTAHGSNDNSGVAPLPGERHASITGSKAIDGISRPGSPSLKVENGKSHSVSYKLTGETGSYRYMAPEVFRHEPYNNKVDVYGYAMILYQLFEGMPPFWSLDPIEAARGAAMEHRRPQWGAVNRHGQVIPAKIKALVEQCWVGDYDARPEFEEVIDSLVEISRELKPDYTHEPSSGGPGGGTSGPTCCTLS